MASEVNGLVQSINGADDIDLNEEDDFAKMLEASFKDQDSGGLVDGVIVSIKDSDDFVLVDVGKKQEALLKKSEVEDKNGELEFSVGDKIKVIITGYKGERPIVSYLKAKRAQKIDEFIKNYDENKTDQIIEGIIVSKNKGGFILENSDGVGFFLPKSQAFYKDYQDQAKVIGKKLKAKIIKIDEDTKSIIVSRKKLADENREKRDAIISKLLKHEGNVEGVIKKITSYGMFVDVGGVDGLVHYSEISYKGPVNPAKIYSENEKVAVKVINYDKDKGHLSLSIKATIPDPWDDLKDQLEVGDSVKVVVSNIEPYGAFVDLGNDIEGFLHVSEISWDKNIRHPKDYLKINQEIDVEVIEIDYQNKKLRVSQKNILPKPFDEFKDKYKEGDVVKGVITTLTNFGAFVKIGSVEGLLHNADASWNRNAKCKDLFCEGDEIEVKITKIDTNQEKISLSVKELQESPIERFAKEYKNGDIISAKIKDIKEFGVFVELEDGIDALIRVEDLGDKRVEELSIGDDIEAAIVFIDASKNRIRLSVKKLSRIKEKEDLKKYNDNEKSTLGDIIRDQLR